MATTRNEHHILKYAKSDARIVTGSNVRNILLLTEKDAIEHVTKHDVKKLKYHKVSKGSRQKRKCHKLWKKSIIFLAPPPLGCFGLF